LFKRKQDVINWTLIGIRPTDPMYCYYRWLYNFELAVYTLKRLSLLIWKG